MSIQRASSTDHFNRKLKFMHGWKFTTIDNFVLTNSFKMILKEDTLQFLQKFTWKLLLNVKGIQWKRREKDDNVGHTGKQPSLNITYPVIWLQTTQQWLLWASKELRLLLILSNIGDKMCSWVLEVKPLVLVSPIISPKALGQKGIHNFKDDKLQRGEVIGSQLLKTIEESRVSMIISFFKLCSVEMVFRWSDQDHGVHERKKTNSSAGILPCGSFRCT